jgi:hypothetical protein
LSHAINLLHLPNVDILDDFADIGIDRKWGRADSPTSCSWRLPLGMAGSPSVFLVAAIQHTSKIMTGPLVYALPLHHPLRLYEERELIAVSRQNN